jgi:hypothetical protein
MTQVQCARTTTSWLLDDDAFVPDAAMMMVVALREAAADATSETDVSRSVKEPAVAHPAPPRCSWQLAALALSLSFRLQRATLLPNRSLRIQKKMLAVHLYAYEKESHGPPASPVQERVCAGRSRV